MPSNAILHEAQQLHKVSERLNSRADQHPLVSDALVTISGNVRKHRQAVGSAGGDENGVTARVRSRRSL